MTTDSADPENTQFDYVVIYKVIAALDKIVVPRSLHFATGKSFSIAYITKIDS